jgi:MGT family glycosyltransferase
MKGGIPSSFEKKQATFAWKICLCSLFSDGNGQGHYVIEREEQMATIVFFSQPYYGHTHPTLPVVTELVRRGERVIYYSLEDFQPVIEQTGALFRSYGKAFPFEHEEAYDNQFIFYVRFLEVSQLVLEHLLPAIRADSPDAIMYDQLCVWGPALAQLLDIPAISYMTMFVITPWLVISDPAQLRNRLLSEHLVRRIRALTKKISATYGVRRPSLFEMANNPGQLNIVFTSRYFQPRGDTFNETYTFVGSSIVRRADTPAFPYEVLDKERPLLYISLGTVYNTQQDFYRCCFAAFAGSRYQVVLSVGRKTPISSLGAIPANFIVREYVPQLDILQRAALFISHGGMNSVSEALYYGMPLVVIPQSADQPWVAKRVVQLGAGRMIRRTHVSASRLRSVTEEVLADEIYAQMSKRIGETLREAGGPKRAADAIQQLLHNVQHYAPPVPNSWVETLMYRLSY